MMNPQIIMLFLVILRS